MHGLFLRFRQCSIDTTADIEAMFVQIGLQPQVPEKLRFLGSEDGTVKKQSTHVWGHMFTFFCNLSSAEVCNRPQTRASRGIHVNHAAVLNG